MGNTVYASFADPSLAEKAAGALLDHGVRAEDLSVVTNQGGEVITTPAVQSGTTWSADGDNDAKNAADAGWGGVKAAGDKVAEMGDRTMGAVNDALGNESAAQRWDAAADRQNAEADHHAGQAKGEWNDAIDQDKTYTSREVETRVEDPQNIESAAKHGISTTTGADAGAGAIKGAGWGLGLGAVAALASLFIPGVGLVVGGGALAAAIGGVAAATGAGAAAGAVTGYLKDQGVDEHLAADYERTVTGGGAILAVSLPSGDCSKEEAMQVLQKYGAGNINAYDVRSGGNTGYVA